VEDFQELFAGNRWDALLDGTLLLGTDELLTTESLGVWVESEENSLVLEGVLLLGEWSLGDGLTSGSDDGLDLVRVDETGDIGSGDLGGWEGVTGLLGVDVIQSGNGGFGPDNESTDVTTWGELEEVKSIDRASLDTWNVFESSNDTLILGVNDKGTTSLPVTPVPHLSLSGSEFSGV